MSPFFILAMASSATFPRQSVAKPTGRFTTSATAAATGLRELASSGPPLGRPKWASKITLPPLSAISVIVEATRSMRVLSATLPFSVGTLRSTLRSTRLPETSASSSVRKGLLMDASPEALQALLVLPAKAGIQGRLHVHFPEKGGPGLDARCAGMTRSGQMVLAIATAVSDMRLEKPHSLSYQERTRTNVPSMTL